MVSKAQDPGSVEQMGSGIGKLGLGLVLVLWLAMLRAVLVEM